MNYWVIKGNPNGYDWNKDLIPEHVEDWSARSLPADLKVGDRLFLWESGRHRRIVGFGETVRVKAGRNREGKRVFYARYLTRPLSVMPGIAELRKVPLLQSASFLQPGPFATVYPLSRAQARALYRLIVRFNPHEHIWRDLGGVDTPAPLIDLEAEALEGNPRLITHFSRERARWLAPDKKAQFLRRHGKLFCEACGQDHAAYGALSAGAFEVHHHHALGLRTAATKTKLSELSLLCATCHRVIHRTVPMPTVSAFKQMIRSSFAKS